MGRVRPHPALAAPRMCQRAPVLLGLGSGSYGLLEEVPAAEPGFPNPLSTAENAQPTVQAQDPIPVCSSPKSSKPGAALFPRRAGQGRSTFQSPHSLPPAPGRDPRSTRGPFPRLPPRIDPFLIPRLFWAVTMAMPCLNRVLVNLFTIPIITFPNPGSF